MRVLVVTNMYPSPGNPFYGIFVQEQVHSLRAHGLIVDVATSKLAYPISVSRLFQRLRHNHYDLIHAHHTYCVFPARLAMALAGARAPLVLTFHEGEVHNAAFRPKGLKRLVFSKRLKRMALARADLVITVQQALTEALAYPGDAQTIPCGVDAALFRPMDRTQCRRRLGLPLDRRIVFFPAARSNEQKGIHVLEQALARLNRPDVELVAAGAIEHERMPEWMNAADVVCQLSLFEASPMALKEAMAVNARVVFTDAGDALQIMGDTPGCYCCERSSKAVATALASALDDPRPARTRARIIATGLSLDAVARRNIAAYRRLCGGALPDQAARPLRDPTG